MTNVFRLASVVVVAPLASSSAFAGTWTAGCDACDYSLIADAVAKVPAGSVIDIYPGDYKVGRLVIERDLTLQSKRGAVKIEAVDNVLLDVGNRLTVVKVAVTGDVELNGGGRTDARLVMVRHGAELTLTDVELTGSVVADVTDPFDIAGLGVTVDGAALKAVRSTFSLMSGAGRDGGAISAWNKSTVTLIDCAFDDNDAKKGGAVAAWAGSSVVMTGENTFLDNSAAVGGAMYVDGGRLTVSGAVFEGNAARESGGAVALVAPLAVFTSSTFDRNSSVMGGAMHAQTKGSVTISGGSFDGNTARKMGGHLRMIGGVTTTLTVSTLRNGASLAGGAVSVDRGDLTLRSVKMYDNVAVEGGHLQVEGAPGALAKVSLTQDSLEPRNVLSGGGLADGGTATAADLGGALYGKHVKLDMSFTDVSEGDAWAGAGLYLQDSEVLVRRSTFVDNEAHGTSTSGHGGAIFAERTVGPLKLWSSTFEDNVAGGSGGAVFSHEGGAGDLRTSVFRRNEAGATGGALDASEHPGVVVVRDSQFSRNVARDGGGAVSIDRAPSWFVGSSTSFINNAVIGPSAGAGHSASGSPVLGRGGGAVRLVDGRRAPASAIVTGASFVGNSASDHGGAVLADRLAVLTMTDSDLTDNHTDGHGAGAYVHGLRSLSVTDLTVDGNLAGLDGGGLVVSGVGTVTAVNLDLLDNVAGGVGGGLMARNNGVGTLVFEGAQSWRGNRSDLAGGAVYVVALKTVEVAATDAWENVTGGDGGVLAVRDVDGSVRCGRGHLWGNGAQSGGAVWVEGDTDVALGAMLLDHNHAAVNGGAVGVQGEGLTLTLDGTSVLSNSGTSGAGVHVQRARLVTLKGARIASNASTGPGGGLYAESTELLVDAGTSFKSNAAGGPGGGLAAMSDVNTSIDGALFEGNSAAEGGAMALRGSSTDAIGVALFNNLAVNDGGAISARDLGSLSLRESTVRQNWAGTGGGLGVSTVDVLELIGVTFEANVATHDDLAVGGAVRVDGVAVLTVEDSVFLQDEARDGGSALYSLGGGEVRVVRNVVCGAVSETGRALELRGGEGDAYVANNVMDGRGLASGRLLGVYGRSAQVVHNHVLGSQDTALVLDAWTGTVSDNLFLAHTATRALGVPDETSRATLAYNAFFATGTEVAGGVVNQLPGVVLDPPLLVAWPVSFAEPCPLPRYYPRPGSPLVGAGSSSWPDLGPDGEVRDDGYSTIGAFGGPDADPALFRDGDDDGVVQLLDCDDADPAQTDGAFLWPDLDDDGLGDRSKPPSYECFGVDGWVANADDCDDADQETGEGQRLWPDLDGDGLGDRSAVAGYACLRPGWVDNDLDCDDTVTWIGASQEVWPDMDGDGFGDADQPGVPTCDPGPGLVRNNMDCDDLDAERVSHCASAWYGTRCTTGGGAPSWLWLLLPWFVGLRRGQASRGRLDYDVRFSR